MSASGRATRLGGALATLLLIGSPAPAADPAPSPATTHALASPSALRHALDAALIAGDRSALEQLLTPGFIYATRGDAERVFARALDSRAPLTFHGARSEGDRATLTGALGEQPIVLLARHTPGGWRLDGASPDHRLGPRWLNGLELRPEPDRDLAYIAHELAEALNGGALIERHLSRGFARAEDDGAQAMLDQSRRKALQWVPRDARAREARGAVAVDIERGGRRIDRVWWLAERSAAGWQIAAITESPDRIEGFLAGRLPARLTLEALPSAPGPADLAGRFRAALLGARIADITALFGPTPARAPGMGPPRARAWIGRIAPTIRAITPPTVYALTERGRALIRMQVTHRADGKPQTETLWIYAGRSDGRWVIADLGRRPSMRWLYMR